MMRLDTIKSSCFLIAIIILLSLFAYTSNAFLRPLDDFKELCFYAGAYLLGLILLWRQFQRRDFYFQEKCEWLFLDGLILAFLVYQAIHLLLQEGHQYESLLELGKSFAFFIFYLAVRKLDVRQHDQLHQLIALGLFLVCVMNLWFKDPARQLFFMKPFGHVSYAADTFLLGVFLLLRLYWKTASFWQRCYYGLCLTFCFLFLWQLANRSSFLGFVMGGSVLFVLTLLYRSRNLKALIKKIFPLLLACTVVFLLAKMQKISLRHDSTMARFQEILPWADRSLSTSHISRLQMYNATLNKSLEKPLLGWGYGSFRFIYPSVIQDNFIEKSVLDLENKHWVMHPHSEIINQFFSGGVFGLTLLLMVTFHFLFPLVKNLSQHLADLLPLLAGLIAIGLSTSFNTTWEHPNIKLLVALYLGLGTRILYPVMPRHQFLQQRSLPYFHALGLILLLALGTALVANRLSSYYLRLAQLEMAKKGQTQAHKTAVWLSPYSFEASYNAASLEIQMNHPLEADHLLAKLKSQFPLMPIIPFQRGLIHLGFGDTKMAQDFFAEALQINPDFRAAKVYLNIPQ